MVDVDSESHHSFKFVAPRKDGANWRGRIQNLKELCLDVLMKNRRQLRKVGKAPYWLMKPIYDKLEPNELEELEKLNPGLKEDTMELWKKHCVVQFPDEYNSYNVPGQDWRALFFMQKDEEAQRLVRARERLRKSTQENKKRRKVKLINHLNLPPVKRNYGGWVKSTPLQRELKKTLRSGAYEHRTHFTQLESGPTMMTVPADWLQRSRDSNPRSTSSSSTMGGSNHRIPVQVELPSKYLPTNMKACSERRRPETKISSVSNREFDRNYQSQTPFNRSAVSNSSHSLTRSNIPPTSASSFKRVREAETTVSVTKRARAEYSTDVHSTRVNSNSTRSLNRQANVTHSSLQRVANQISRPQKVSDSSFSRNGTVSKQPPEKVSVLARTNKLPIASSRSIVSTLRKTKPTSTDSCRLEPFTTSKYDSKVKLSSAKLAKTNTIATDNAGKAMSIKKDVRHEPYRAKRRSVVYDD